MEDEIVSLSLEYYQNIGPIHHKDKDCHWYISKVFSYGREPYYRVEHYGYLWDREFDGISDIAFSTYEDAEAQLLETIKDAVQESREWGK